MGSCAVIGAESTSRRKNFTKIRPENGEDRRCVALAEVPMIKVISANITCGIEKPWWPINVIITGDIKMP